MGRNVKSFLSPVFFACNTETDKKSRFPGNFALKIPNIAVFGDSSITCLIFQFPKCVLGTNFRYCQDKKSQYWGF